MAATQHTDFHALWRQSQYFCHVLSNTRGDYATALAAPLLAPSHNLMRPPPHSAFDKSNAFRKLALFLEPQDVLRGVFIHGSASLL
jgi:hypothetical protein